MPATPQMRFVVKRLNWVRSYQGILKREPGEVRVASFATFDEANEDRNKRELQVRQNRNPFHCGNGVHMWTHLDELRLRDWLMDRGIDVPMPNNKNVIDWGTWWQKSGKKLTAEHKAIVWEALDKLRFFTVREEPVRPVGYAVLEVNWEYNDEYFDADSEGGNLVKVFRSRERAEAECANRNTVARRQWGGFGRQFAELYANDESDDEEFDPNDLPVFDMRKRLARKRGFGDDSTLKPREGYYASTAGVPFFEVIEVELEGLE
jgi:hypothetical protein